MPRKTLTYAAEQLYVDPGFDLPGDPIDGVVFGIEDTPNLRIFNNIFANLETPISYIGEEGIPAGL